MLEIDSLYKKIAMNPVVEVLPERGHSAQICLPEDEALWSDGTTAPSTEFRNVLWDFKNPSWRNMSKLNNTENPQLQLIHEGSWNILYQI